MLEAIFPAPQASSAPQHLIKWLPFERFSLAKQPHRSADELGCRCSLARCGGIEPCLVGLVE
jgi:hypothetical protein